MACGKFDPNRNTSKHFKADHHAAYTGQRWIKTPVALEKLPEYASLPDEDMLKSWKGVDWKWMGLPDPADFDDSNSSDDDDDDDDGDDGVQNAAEEEEEEEEIVTFRGQTMTKSAANELLYARHPSRASPEPEL